MRLSARMGLASGLLGVVLVVVFVVLFVAIGRQSDAASEARTSERIIAKAGDLRSSLLSIESAERGFLLTGQEQFLGPFEKARLKWPGQSEDLQDLVVDDPIQARRAAILDRRIRRYVQGYAVPLLARARHGITMAEASAAVVRGKSLVDPLQQDFDHFNARELEI